MTTHARGRVAPAFAALVAFALLLTACGDDGPYIPAGIIRTPAPNVSDIVMPNSTEGGEIRFQAEPDGLLLIYFGYTACPDVCPTTMADVRKMMRNLGDLSERIDVAMVTVDPDRDTPEVLTAYVQAFVPDGVAITTTDADLLAAAAEPFGAKYGVEVLEDGWVDVVHTGFLYAVDDDGILQLTWPFGIESELIEADVRAIFDGRLGADA